MSYILRVLDYEPDNRDVLDLARLMVWGCIGAHHSCREPLSEVQINDRRLDHLFNECEECSLQWIPSPSAFEPWVDSGKILLISETGLGGYCSECKKAFCREHVKDPLPTLKFGLNPRCPKCVNKLDCYHVYGRKARQAPRQNKKLSHVVLVRDGIIPPDKEYCLKVFRYASSDVLEDLPYTIGMNMQSWEYDAKCVLDEVVSWLKAQPQHRGAMGQLDIWSGLDSETKTRFHLIKIWGTLSKVTLDNLFTISPNSEDFPFETATLLNKSIPDSHSGPPNWSDVGTGHNPNNTSYSNAAVAKEFIDAYEKYFFEGLAGLPDPSRVEPSQVEKLNMTAVNKAGDLIMRKYNLSEQEAARIAEQAIKAMAISLSKGTSSAG